MQNAQRVQVLHACCNVHEAQHSCRLRMWQGNCHSRITVQAQTISERRGRCERQAAATKPSSPQSSPGTSRSETASAGQSQGSILIHRAKASFPLLYDCRHSATF